MKTSSVAWTPGLYTDTDFDSSKVPGAFTLLEDFKGEWIVSVLGWDTNIVCQVASRLVGGPFVAKRAIVRKEVT